MSLDRRGRLWSPEGQHSWRPAFALLVALGAVCVSLGADRAHPVVPDAALPSAQVTIAADPERALRIARARLRIFAILDAPTDVSVDKLPLSDFVRLLSKQHGIPFTLDRAGLRRGGVRPDARVSVQVRNVALEMGLRKALQPLHLRCFATADGVVISDWDWIDNHRTRTEILETVKTQLAVEIAFVRNVCALSADQIRGFKQDLSNRVVETFDRLGPLSCEELSQTLTDAVVQRLTKEQAIRYRAELEQRRQLEREACIEMFVAILDEHMHLSEQQRQALVDRLTRAWTSAWTQTVEVCLERGREVPRVPDHVIEPVLDPDQIAIWKRFTKNGTLHPAFDPVRIGSTAMPVVLPEEK